jgi:hypothetical protein
MSGGRSRWWVHKDAARVLARAEASSGGPASDAELLYMHAHCQLLLAEVLPLAERDRERLRALYHELHRTLAERTVGCNGGREATRKEQDG